MTPTIGADSALDLSFIGDANGTATITVRATDGFLEFVDDVFVVTVNPVNDQPTVVSAIPDTIVNENDPPLNNYRDLNAVFDDLEEGSALTFTIENNTNPGLVTPTIGVADSALDLSFTASTNGTATITVRATDGGALFVDEVFTVLVLCAPVPLPFSDSFDRANSGTVGNCWWDEYEVGTADATINSNRLQLNGDNESQSPRILHTFTDVSTGWLKWSYVFNWENTGGEGTYELWMQLGNNATWVDPATSDNTGVAVNLKWASATRGMTNDQGFGFVQGGTTTEVAVVNGGGDHTIEVFANLDLNIFTLKIDGVTQVAGAAFDNNVSIDAVRIYTDELGTGAFNSRDFDDMTIDLHTNLAPTVAAAIPDTTVNEDNPTIDNYRDLNAVFSDSEDDGALTFTIQSNTNPGLVTPTIGADSALDLSFVAEANGTATITIRAEDSGTLTVDDVFIVTVNAVNDQPTVVSAIPDTTVTKDAAPLDNFRDLKTVFDDVEEGSALTYIVQDNTNPGLVTPTIGADSALDLSFTASTLGTATITIRATDGGALFVDDVFTVTVNDPPTVAAAIPDTTVNEDNPAIDNYRDLKAVFTDLEDGSGLTFSIQSNTNPGLVTPTIVAADSTLDLSFTAEGNGTATITVRATDSGLATVDDVFTVTVNAVNDQPTVIAAIPDTTVIENNPAIDNYRDLNAVFDDVEDGSALTFTIQNNTNPFLVTPTIGADSALDLSFTASTFGASTITIRATDGGGLTVDDVFTVTVFQATGIAVATDDCDMGQDGSTIDNTGSVDLFNGDEWGAFCFVNIGIPQAFDTSPISSSRSVPPSAAAKSPLRSPAAPVKAPRTCPKSSDSSTPSASAAQFTGRKGPSARSDSWWIARATSSLPVPVSPVTSTVASVGATRAMISKTARIDGDRPNSPPGGSAPADGTDGRRSRRASTRALRTSGSTGFVRKSSAPVWRAVTGGIDGPKAADHEDRCVLTPRAKHLDDPDPVQPRHTQVEEDQVELGLLEPLDRRSTVSRLVYVVPVLPHESGGRHTKCRVVVHNEEAGRGHVVVSEGRPAV